MAVIFYTVDGEGTGYATRSEAVTLKKPIYSILLANHFEQGINNK